MKKDLNWFKEQLDDIEMNTPSLWSHDSIWMLDRVNELLDELDEPDEREQLEVAYKDILSRREFLFDDKKYVVVEKPVIPKIVAEFLDGKEDYALYELFDNEWLYEKYDQIAKWLYNNDEETNRERELSLVLAQRYGYEVEAEPKYILAIDITDESSNTRYTTYLNKRGIFHSMDNESFNDEEYQWSEEEIRDLNNGDILFEHFAVKVEEMEE